MIAWLFSLVILNAVLWCLSALPKYPLRGYFMAQLVYTLLYPIALLRGIESMTYSVTVAVLTGAILWQSFWLTKQYALALPNPGEVTISGIGIALFLGILSAHGIDHPMGFASWVNITEGTVLIGLAWALGMSSPHWLKIDAGKAQIAIVLCVLWACLAAWAFGWPMFWNEEIWQRLNYLVPCWLIVASFTFVGYRLRCE